MKLAVDGSNGSGDKRGIALQVRRSAFAHSREDARERSWRRHLAVALAAVALIIGSLVFLLTDAAPRVAASPPPTAEQVAVARAAARQFRFGEARASNAVIRLTSAELAAVSALASNGFRPDRLLVKVKGGTVIIEGSRQLPLGRWLNLTVATRGGGTGFPPARLTVGSISFPQSISRFIFDGARHVLTRRGAQLPPLDRLVRRVTIQKGVVTATVGLPPGSVVLAQLGGNDAPANPAGVREAYCRLARLQTARPSDDLAMHVRRAFAVDPKTPATTASNRAALIALAMLTVDARVGELAGLDPATIAKCRVVPVATNLNGRADLPKHWALSAALAAATGTQFSQAMGEWKELADSIARQSQFAQGDPSGFSFVDLAADRSGFLIAGQAVAPGSAVTVAAALARAQQADLLPPALMRLEEGTSEASFNRRYGDTSDPRFVATVARIDAELRRSAVARSGPLAALP